MRKSNKSTMSTRSVVINNPAVQEEVRERLLSVMSRRKSGSWSGTMTTLLSQLTSRRVSENFPKNGSSLRRVLNEIVPSLRRAGYSVEFTRASTHERTRMIEISRS